MSPGPERVLALVHDTDADRGTREVGSILPALRAAGLAVDVATLLGPSELLTDLPEPAALRAVVVMGSKEAAYDDAVLWLATELAYLQRVVAAGTPVLGVCFGGQALARVLGGTVTRAAVPEHGFTTVSTTAPEVVPAGPWMEFHGDTFTVPPGATELARTDAAPQAFRLGPHLGLQFHPEITPGAYDAWFESWALDGELDAVRAAGIDVTGLRADVVARADAAAARCARLVGEFLGLSAARGQERAAS